MGERMVRESEQYAQEDKTKRQTIDIKNQSESVIYQTRKQVSEFGDKLPQELKAQIDEEIKELETAIKSEDVEKMKERIEDFQKKLLKLGKLFIAFKINIRMN